MANGEIGFAVIGLGVGMGRAKMATEAEGARLVAVAELNEERGRKAEQDFGAEFYADYREMLKRDDIDAVLVMAESGKHAEIGIDIARAGKHVVTTKPIDVKLPAIDSLMEECDRAGVRLVTDFNFRYLAKNVWLKRAVDRGDLGDLIFGEARLKWWRAESYYDDWHGTWELDGGGALMNQTVHQVDLLQWYLGDVETVYGKTGIYSHSNIETEDLGVALLKFKSGALGSIVGTTTFPESGLEPTIEIHGNKGAVVTARGNITLCHLPEGAEGPDEFQYDGPVNIIEDVVGMLRNGEPPFVTGPEARKSVEIVLAIYESARTGKEVSLPLA